MANPDQQIISIRPGEGKDDVYGGPKGWRIHRPNKNGIDARYNSAAVSLQGDDAYVAVTHEGLRSFYGVQYSQRLLVHRGGYGTSRLEEHNYRPLHAHPYDESPLIRPHAELDRHKEDLANVEYWKKLTGIAVGTLAVPTIVSTMMTEAHWANIIPAVATAGMLGLNLVLQHRAEQRKNSELATASALMNELLCGDPTIKTILAIWRVPRVTFASGMLGLSVIPNKTSEPANYRGIR